MTSMPDTCSSAHIGCISPVGGTATMKLRFRNAVAALALLSAQAASAQEQPLTTKCELAPLMAAFAVFSETGRMPPNLANFIGDAASNKIEPYKAFRQRLLRRHLLGLRLADHLAEWPRADRHALRPLHQPDAG